MTDMEFALEYLKTINERTKTIEDKQDKMHDEFMNILKIIHGTMTEILANLTAEQGGDLVDALRRLTEAVNALGTTVAANPTLIVSKIAPLIAENNK